MTESTTQETVVATPVKTPKSKKAISLRAKGNSKKAAPGHPPTSQMVNNAIKNLKERGGSSLQAIKKYIAGTYKVDAEKLAPFIKKYLKSAVDNGSLIRTKGKGASGSFKLAVSKPETVKKAKKPKVEKKKVVKAAGEKKPKASKPKKAKATTPKKPKAAPKPKTEKAIKTKVASVTPKKAPSKAKKVIKAVKKPKSPKLKKVAPKKVTKKTVANK